MYGSSFKALAVPAFNIMSRRTYIITIMKLKVLTHLFNIHEADLRIEKVACFPSRSLSLSLALSLSHTLAHTIWRAGRAASEMVLVMKSNDDYFNGTQPPSSLTRRLLRYGHIERVTRVRGVEYLHF